MYFPYSQVFLCLPGTELSKSQRNLCKDSLSSAATCFSLLLFFNVLATGTTRSRLTSAVHVYRKCPGTRNGWGSK